MVLLDYPLPTGMSQDIAPRECFVKEKLIAQLKKAQQWVGELGDQEVHLIVGGHLDMLDALEQPSKKHESK
jgi:hypothetical protein